MSHTKQPCGCTSQHNGDGAWFIEWCPLHRAAPALKEALSRCIPWMGKLIANEGHLKAVRPQAAIEALKLAEEAYATAKGR